MRNIKKELKMHVFRNRDRKIYYFDEEETVQCISIEQAQKMRFENLSSYELSHISILTTYDFINRLVAKKYFTVTNVSIVCKYLCMLKIGEDTKKLDSYLSTAILNTSYLIEGLDRFVTKIERPIFIQETGNQNTKTFDIIRIQANIIEDWPEDRTKYIKENINEITMMVIKKLEKLQNFKKYGIPTNFLRVSHITITADSSILFILELKSI